MRSIGIIGLGSIGRRHARILKSLDPDLQVFAFRTRTGALQGPSEHVVEIDREAFFSSRFDVIVIANPSAMHLRTLQEVLRADLANAVLVEKPFCLPGEAAAAERLIAEATHTRILPGNTLRFHPAIPLLKASLESGSLGQALECHAHFGTYMPGWHQYEDYRSTYAARRDLGGGVLLTSIHEIDLVHHLFGAGRVAAACVGRLSLKEIDVEDSAHVLLTLDGCKVANISLNFFERPSDRFLKVIFERGVWLWKFGQSAVSVTAWHGNEAVESLHDVDATVDAMYVRMWRAALANELRDFELASVFSSLRTADAARTAGEVIQWN